jgi:hypothetical protein
MESKTLPPDTSGSPGPTNGHASVPSLSVAKTASTSRTVYIQKLNAATRITPQARQYAIEELARRAGVPESFYRSWKITTEQYRTTVHIANGRTVQITFPHAAADVLRDLVQGKIYTSRACWMREPSGTIGQLIPDFIVPFSGANNGSLKPLFIARSADHVECTVDLPLSVLLTLSRWEETLEGHRDEHGRFPAQRSISVRDGFLHRPIVDEYGFAFLQALQFVYPSWPEPQRALRVKLSHDADHIGIPFGWKQVVRHTTHYRNPTGSCRELWQLFSGAPPAELRALCGIVTLALERRLDTSVYWMGSSPNAWDSGYDPRLPLVRQVIRWLDDHEVENGVHPGYYTFSSPERLRREVSTVREVLGDRPLGGRHHYLRWHPEMWIHWETTGLAYDSSVGYPERVGFRAGTCVPYRPWLFPLNRAADLLEIPLLVMDGSLLVYMKLSDDESVREVQDIVSRCRAVGGVFTMVWHNNYHLDPRYRSAYTRLLNLFDSSQRFDWQSEVSR